MQKRRCGPVEVKGHGLQAAWLWQHFSWKDETKVISLVSQWDFKSYDSTTTCAIFEKNDIPSIVKSNEILCAVNWTLNKNASCRLLLPWLYRPAR